jgi:hypothetical protein
MCACTYAHFIFEIDWGKTAHTHIFPSIYLKRRLFIIRHTLKNQYLISIHESFAAAVLFLGISIFHLLIQINCFSLYLSHITCRVDRGSFLCRFLWPYLLVCMMRNKNQSYCFILFSVLLWRIWMKVDRVEWESGMLLYIHATIHA